VNQNNTCFHLKPPTRHGHNGELNCRTSLAKNVLFLFPHEYIWHSVGKHGINTIVYISDWPWIHCLNIISHSWLHACVANSVYSRRGCQQETEWFNKVNSTTNNSFTSLTKFTLSLVAGYIPPYRSVPAKAKNTKEFKLFNGQLPEKYNTQ
jgi:hypothetical protein